MGLLGNLFGRSKKTTTAKRDVSVAQPEIGTRRVVEIEGGQPAAPSAPAGAAPNIWDIATDDNTPAAPAASPAPAIPTPAAPAAADASEPAMASAPRRRRTKTRLIGFDQGEGQVVDLFGAESQANAEPRSVKFPVGWIAVIGGQGRGEVFALHTGMSQIGRGEDQAIQLDFGDTSISRSNHAAIVYDPEMHKFFLGHGGKSNVVRLNDAPLISNEVLKTGDIIRLGETTLKFVALCDDEFNWEDQDSKGTDDVEIA